MTLVRRARAEDADAVFELVRQLGAAFVPVRSIFDETFAEIVEGDDQHVQVIVAEDDQGAVRGYALTTISRLLSTNGLSAQLQEIAVDEDARGLALGTALVREVEAECIRRGVRQLTVAARRAGGFYDRLGYSQNAEHMRRVF
ncbi:MAG: GNAT family N-acetyltransferase [Yonghaparkia sp.]|nr:GNAT family N-acetyltransferase [Microcella sp.]